MPAARANARGDDSAGWPPRVWAWRVVTWRPLRGDRYAATVTWRPGLGAVRAVPADARVAGGSREWASLWPLAWCRSQADLCTCRGSAFRRRRGHQRRRERFLIWVPRALPYLGVESASLFGRRERFLIWASRSLLYGSARWRGRERQIARQGERHRMGTGARRRTHTEECVAPSGDEQFQIWRRTVPNLGRQSGTKREDRDARLADTSTGQKARPAHVTCGLPAGRGPRP